VPPTRGVYKGEAESELSVLVTVLPVDAPEPEELPRTTVIPLEVALCRCSNPIGAAATTATATDLPPGVFPIHSIRQLQLL